MDVSKGLIVFTGSAVGGMIPWKNLNFQNFRNAILGTLAEHMHYKL